MSQTTPTDRLFFYGTLRDPAVRAIVLGSGAPLATPAVIRGHRAVTAEGEDFPMLISASDAVTEGVAIEGLSEEMQARVAFFEDDDEFELAEVEIDVAGATVPAQVFLAKGRLRPGAPWTFEAWVENGRAALIECAEELMELYEQKTADWSDPLLWPGIRNRARARALATAEAGRPNPSGMTRDDVRLIRRARPYASYFAIEEHWLRHRRFDGTWGEEIKRGVFTSGDAVAVLPYDPALDRVHLVSQWRAGPWARGDAQPWTMEMVAGRIDGDEEAETVARREAVEEAGLTLGAIEQVSAFYPAPGAVAERITVFVGQADLSGEGGVHGLAHEGEDIKGFILPLDEALEMCGAGAIDTSPPLIALLWLARERERLRREWGALSRP